jgi:L-alanine-DL-glutamate epimerase-like enolase superfamily enzyme
MEITDVSVHVLSLPEIEDVADGSQDAAIVEVETDAGITGVGEIAGAPPVVAKAIVEAGMSSSNATGLRRVVVGRDPFDVEAIWNELYDRTYAYGRRGAAIAAVSGVDTALWDVVGKATEQPIHRLLGGKHRDAVRAYASTLFPEDPANTDHVRREAEDALSKGFTAIKYGWGAIAADHETDRAMLRAARETLGGDVDLMVDVGMAWGTDVKRAVKEATALDEEFDLYWIEEPVYADDYDAYARVSEACPARVVGGEREHTQYGFREFIDRGDPDGVQPDVAIAGGITQMDKIATMARNAGIPIYPHGYSTDVVIAANLHVIAANENAPLLEYCVEDSPLRWELVEESFELVDGEVPIPDRPGLGITLDRDALAEYAVEPWTDWSVTHD